MTLYEYIMQNNPARMPHVILDIKEYWEGSYLKSLGLQQIFIKYYFDVEYVKKDGDTVLWTTDHHDNPKSRSCFHVPLNH